MLSDPPKTVCEAQLEFFKKAQQSFLYKDPKSKEAKTTKFERLFEHCKVTNSPGGCMELFQLTKTFLQDLDSVPEDCRSTAGGIKEVKTTINYITELMIRLAWREKLPRTYQEKFGWLEVSDISLYCKLKQKYSDFYGEASWSQFRERIMGDLPGAKQATRTQVWDFSILSENCARYP